MENGQSIENPLARIPPDIEQRVGAPKNYADMSMQELRDEDYRITRHTESAEGHWNRVQARTKLVNAVVERRRKDFELLGSAIAEPPVPEGYIRVYRGEDEEGLGQYGTREAVAGKSGKWFSTDLKKAAAFAENHANGGRVRYMDVLQSDFEILNDSSRTPKDIQVPLGYDLQMGSKLLMSDGSIPPELLQDKDDKESEKQVQMTVKPDKPQTTPNPTRESLIPRLLSKLTLGR